MKKAALCGNGVGKNPGWTAGRDGGTEGTLVDFMGDVVGVGGTLGDVWETLVWSNVNP